MCVCRVSSIVSIRAKEREKKRIRSESLSCRKTNTPQARHPTMKQLNITPFFSEVGRHCCIDVTRVDADPTCCLSVLMRFDLYLYRRVPSLLNTTTDNHHTALKSMATISHPRAISPRATAWVCLSCFFTSFLPESTTLYLTHGN